MEKKSLAAVSVIAIVACVAVTLFFYSQLSELTTRNTVLTEQTAALQVQNSTLQTQLKEQQLQSQEQQDRLCDYTAQLAQARHLKVEITDAYCSKGWEGTTGLTASFPASVTVVNSDVVPLCGLTVSFRFVDRDSGNMVGFYSGVTIDRINTGETQIVEGYVEASVATQTGNLVCQITLSSGSVVLDTWTQPLN